MKLREYMEKSIFHYNAYVKQYYYDEDPEKPQFPSKIDADELGPFLRAQFYCARLHGRLASNVGENQVFHLKKKYVCRNRCCCSVDRSVAYKCLKKSFD